MLVGQEAMAIRAACYDDVFNERGNSARSKYDGVVGRVSYIGVMSGIVFIDYDDGRSGCWVKEEIVT